MKKVPEPKIPATCNIRRGFSLYVLGQPVLAPSKTINRKEIEHVSVHLSASKSLFEKGSDPLRQRPLSQPETSLTATSSIGNTGPAVDVQRHTVAPRALRNDGEYGDVRADVAATDRPANGVADAR